MLSTNHVLRFLGVAVLCLVSEGALTAGLVDFDSIAATCCYDLDNPGPRGPVLTIGILTLDGGVVMNNSGWLDKATSAPNLYGSADTVHISGYGYLPGSITGTFSIPVFSLTMDVINGEVPGTFTLTAYNGADVVDSEMVDLAYYSDPGSSATLSVSGLITSFTVTSTQEVGRRNIAIDTISFEESSVPEPSSILLMSAALAFIPALRRVRK